MSLTGGGGSKLRKATKKLTMVQKLRGSSKFSVSTANSKESSDSDFHRDSLAMQQRRRPPKWLMDHITSCGLKHIRDAYHMVDKNEDKELQREEFYQFMRFYGRSSSPVELTEGKLRLMFNDASNGQTCPITFKSVVDWLSDLHASELFNSGAYDQQESRKHTMSTSASVNSIYKARAGGLINQRRMSGLRLQNMLAASRDAWVC
jgi:hypothetical protein